MVIINYDSPIYSYTCVFINSCDVDFFVSIFRHLKLELLAQLAPNDEK